MQIKEIKPITFLYYRAESTTVKELQTFIDQQIPFKMQKDAVDNGMWLGGPVYWNYFGFTSPEQPFTLEISIPVNHVPEQYNGAFKLRTSEPFKCVSDIHEGGWLEIPNTYARIFQFIQQNQLKPNGNYREIYVHADFSHPERNITDLQVGIE